MSPAALPVDSDATPEPLLRRTGSAETQRFQRLPVKGTNRTGSMSRLEIALRRQPWIKFPGARA